MKHNLITLLDAPTIFLRALRTTSSFGAHAHSGGEMGGTTGQHSMREQLEYEATEALDWTPTWALS
jgi:hypothetical protein